MFSENPFLSDKFLVNRLSDSERQILQNSLLGKTVKVLSIKGWGLFTEHGFPVALSYCSKNDSSELPEEFEVKVIKVNPMVTIDDFPKN